MKNERVEVTVKFTVKKEFVPGVFYDPQDFATQAERGIKRQLMAYEPKIIESTVKDILVLETKEELEAREGKEARQAIVDHFNRCVANSRTSIEE